MINLMDVLTEEINLELPMIKMANQDEVLSLKETIKFLENERTNQKKKSYQLMRLLNNLKILSKIIKLNSKKSWKNSKKNSKIIIQKLIIKS